MGKASKAKCINVACIQMLVCPDKCQNLETAAKLIKEATKNEAKLIILPECFTMPYSVENFSKYCENQKDGPTAAMLKEAAEKNCVYIVGGSFPEEDCGKIYNTCTVWDPCGEMIAKLRKLHLFDIDIPGKITFKESDSLTKGPEMACCCIEGWKTGIGICYDMRFEELAKLYRLNGAKLLIYPAAFNMTTGPLHFELIQRARAVDNQCYVCTCSPARSSKGYQAWGHSQVTDPWGKILAKAKEKPKIIYATMSLETIKEARKAIPIFCQRRTDIYKLKESKGDKSKDM